MAQVKEVVGSVSTPELETLSSKIVEKSQNLPDETTTTGNENEESEDFEAAQPSSSQPEKQALLCDKCSECFASKKNLDLHELIVHQNDSQPTTPTKPNLVSTPSEPSEPQCVTTPYALRSNKSTPSCPGSYERMVLQNRKELKEQLEKSNMKNITEEMRKYHTKCAEAAEYGLEKAPPRVVREIPPLSLTTRQSAKKSQIVGNLENLEAKKEEGKRIKLAQQLEMKQARAEEKQKKSKTNDLFKQIMNQDPLIRRFDNLSESSVSTLKRKSPSSDLRMGMHNSQTPDQANNSFQSSLSGLKTPLRSDRNDKSFSPDDLSWPSSSSETESPPKAKKFQKMPETTKKSPTPKSETVAPKPSKKSPSKKPKLVGCDPKTAKIKPYQCYKCNSVFKVKTSVKGHFRVKHTQDTYDSSKVLNVKFQCYNCTQAFDSYGKVVKHFELMYPAAILDPKKILVGKTNKSAALLLKLKYGPPPPEIVKKLHGVNKNVPSKIKKVIKITKQVYTFKCGDCDFRHSDLDTVKQHKLTHLQGK